MDPQETPGTVVRRLLGENLKLQQKVFDLEGKLQQHTEAADVQSTRMANFRKLLEQKDVSLERYAADLEEKQIELQKTVRELEKRNEQLQLWMATLRLYQELFERDREGMIAVNREGKIVLFNRTAVEILGDRIREALHKPIEEADFSSFDPGTAALVREALEKHRASERSVTVRGRRVTTAVFPVGTEADPRGVLLKIGVSAEK